MEDTRVVSTAFILMFPALIISIIAIAYASLVIAFIVLALAIYQFLMLKKFIEDYYKKGI